MGFSDHTQGKRNPKGKVSRRKNNCFNLIHRRDSGEPRRWATWTTRVIHINHLGGLFIKLSKQEQIRQIGETESAPIQSVKHSSEIKNPREENSFRGFYWVGLPGFEPRQTEPKPVVLPLHHSPNLLRFLLKSGAKIGLCFQTSKLCTIFFLFNLIFCVFISQSIRNSSSYRVERANISHPADQL